MGHQHLFLLVCIISFSLALISEFDCLGHLLVIGQRRNRACSSKHVMFFFFLHGQIDHVQLSGGAEWSQIFSKQIASQIAHPCLGCSSFPNNKNRRDLCHNTVLARRTIIKKCTYIICTRSR